jgi:hypothetical protein
MRYVALILRLLVLLAFLIVAGIAADAAFSYVLDGYGLHPLAALPGAVAYGLLCWAANRGLQRI